MAILRAGIFIMLCILSGCAGVSPTSSSYDTVKMNDFSNLVISDKDKIIEPIDENITLDDCLKIAFANNPELSAASWEISAADFRIEQTRANKMPILNVEGVYARFLDNQRLIQARFNGEPGDFDRNILRGDIVVKMPIYTGGRISNEIESMELFRNVDEYLMAWKKEELIFNISSVFYTILGQQKVIVSLEFSIKAMDEQLRRVSNLFAAQKAAKLDILKIEVRLADLKQNLIKEKNKLAVQYILLSSLMGITKEKLNAKGELVFKDTSFTFDELITQAKTKRYDYMAAKAKLEAQTKKVNIIKSAKLPSVSLQGNYGFRADFNGNSDDTGSLGVNLTVPIFEGNKTDFRIKEELALLSAAQQKLRKMELQIHQDVKSALLDVVSIRERIKVTEKSIEQAHESLRIERQKYELNMNSTTDMLDAQDVLLQSETLYYRALVEYFIAIAKMNLAIGGLL
ncbi:MAG: TolC family protein [Desulfobacterales bacterium]|nr:TolC family protein [Desulfobacterales bacterium]